MALSSPEIQARVRGILDPRIKATQELGQALGVGEISFLTVSNAEEFGRVPDRLDEDELGLASRLGRPSPRAAIATCSCWACRSAWPPR